ncbi:MAG: sugar phosphate isomerase/epimerase family protein [Candidatus Nitrosopumilus sp. bin_7KS]
MIKSKFLLVQGRTLPQTDSFLQRFPDNWELEFPIMQKLGFSGIEWIYDAFSENNNPIINQSGIKKMKLFSKKYHIKLENIVFDWFLKYPLISKHNDHVVEKLIFLIEQSKITGFKRIIFPLLEDNSINSPSKLRIFKKIFKEKICEALIENNIEMHFETDLNSKLEFKLLKFLDNEKLKICFDMGNSASFGYDPRKHLREISNYLGSVHVKDRKFQDRSFSLGKGDVNFHEVFQSLDLLDFNGPISFQVYRNKNSDNFRVLQNSLNFINNMIMTVNNGSK